MSSDTISTSTNKEGDSLLHVPTVLYENRYCDQDDFSILICGGENENREALNDVYELKGPDFVPMKFPSMLEPRSLCETAVISSDIFVVGGSLSNNVKVTYSVEIWSEKSKTWCYKTQLPDKRRSFRICSFKQNLYIIGGCGVGCKETLSSCLVYNIKNAKWSQIPDMNTKREHVACTVFEGKIVVSSGYLKSVEAYDYYENKWTYLADMIETRVCHASVSMGNKMFVIGGYSTLNSEVFDCYSRKFTSIISFMHSHNLSYFQAVNIGKDIVIFIIPWYSSIGKIYVYDTEIDEYSNIDSKICENLVRVSCLKYYSQ